MIQVCYVFILHPKMALTTSTDQAVPSFLVMPNNAPATFQTHQDTVNDHMVLWALSTTPGRFVPCR